MRPDRHGLARPTEIALAAGLVIAGLAYLALKSVLLDDVTNDYQFIWLAGAMWTEGQNPYSDEYGVRGIALFAEIYAPKVWFYPPNWWPVATLAAQVTFETSVVLWRAMGALCLLAGTALVALNCHRHVAPLSLLRGAAFFAFTAMMSGTAIAFSLGQTSVLSFLGAALFIAAWLGDRRVLMVVALFLLMLKPQIGLPFAMLLLMQRVWWPSLAGGAAVRAVR